MMPDEVRGMYWANIGIFGGLGNIENIGERMCGAASALETKY